MKHMKPRGEGANKTTWSSGLVPLLQFALTKETDAGMSDLQRRFDKFKKKETWQDMFATYTNLYLSTSQSIAFNRMDFNL